MSEILYTPGKGWEFQNDLNYNFYHGYSAGFGRPEVQWDLGISKAIKSVTQILSFLQVSIGWQLHFFLFGQPLLKFILILGYIHSCPFM